MNALADTVRKHRRHVKAHKAKLRALGYVVGKSWRRPYTTAPRRPGWRGWRR